VKRRLPVPELILAKVHEPDLEDVGPVEVWPSEPLNPDDAGRLQLQLACCIGRDAGNLRAGVDQRAKNL
jgi:hypothetical protein